MKWLRSIFRNFCWKFYDIPPFNLGAAPPKCSLLLKQNMSPKQIEEIEERVRLLIRNTKNTYRTPIVSNSKLWTKTRDFLYSVRLNQDRKLRSRND